MRTLHPEKPLVAKCLFDRERHAMLLISPAFFRIPEVMGDKLQKQRLRRRPGQGGSGSRKGPGLQIGEVGGERA